jgi:hypothetical protein
MIDEPDLALAPAALVAEAASVLVAGGYRVDRGTESTLGLRSERALIAEDKYGVVVVVIYDTWRDLAGAWRSAQADAVEIMSSRFTRLDRKAWDGYLVLLTPALAIDGDTTVHEIRYDTSRVRKLVATGEDLRSLSDVGRALLPLLPLRQDDVDLEDIASPLDELPDRLEKHSGIERSLAEAAVTAFKDHRPIVEALQQQLFEQ